VPFLRARILYPATSSLRSLTVGPGLLSRSQRYPDQLQTLQDDVYLLHDDRTGADLAAVDLVGADLAPGEGRTVTLRLSGFSSSPFSVVALAGGSNAQAALVREAAYVERARLRLLATPAGGSTELLQLAGDPNAFREEVLHTALVLPGLVSEDDFGSYISSAPNSLPIPTTDDAPAGPAALLEEALSGDCSP